MSEKKLRARELSGKSKKEYDHLGQLLTEISIKTQSPILDSIIEQELEMLNSLPEDMPEKNLLKHIKTAKTRLLRKIEKELKIVPKNYYRNLWLAVGMALFGIPLAVSFATMVGNIALIAIGPPIGMAIGLAIGSHLDNKAKEEGRQLESGIDPE